MKIRKIIVFTLIIMIPASLSAQESQLTLDQLNEFYLRKLIVELYDIEGNGSSYSEYKWNAYQGEKRISEQNFYLIADHPYEAGQVRKENNRSIAMLVGSPVVLTLGGVLIKVAIENPPKTDEGSETVGAIIVGTLALGVALLVFGVEGLVYKSTTYYTAEKVKNEYNDQLLQEIIETNE